MATTPLQVAKRLDAIADNRLSKANSSIKSSVRRLGIMLQDTISSKEDWDAAGVDALLADFDKYIAESGFADVATEIGEAALEYAEAVDGIKAVNIDRSLASSLQAATEAKYEGWGTVPDDAKAWLKDTLASHTILPISAKDLTEALVKYLDEKTEPYAMTYMETAIHTQLRETWVQAARSMGVDTYTYQGPDSDATRDFCSDRLAEADSGTVWTEDEIAAFDDEEWKGKMDGPTLVVAGGWNCRHSWVPVNSETDNDNRTSEGDLMPSDEENLEE